MADQIYTTATIADTETESDAINVTEFFITSIQIPANMTGTTLQIKVGNSSTDLATLTNDDDTTFEITMSTGAVVYSLDAVHTAGVKYMSLVSGSAESGDKIIKLHGYRI